MRALEDGWIELRRGEAHALVGENGAGKSTLVKILAGVHRPDSGRVLLEGEEVVFDTTAQSHAAGIAIIFQEPTLFPDLTVAENVFIGAQPLRSRRRIDRRRMRREREALFDQLGVKLDPDRIARGLSIADQQIVEIAKALSARGARDRDGRADRRAHADGGRAALRRRRDAARPGRRGALHLAPARRGLRALPARHRDARRPPRARPSGRRDDAAALIHAMVGRDLDALFPRGRGEVGETVLKVDRLTREGVFTDVSFEVKAGEIVALAGLVGAGRSEVARAIFGIDRADAGGVEVHGRKLAAGLAQRGDGRGHRLRARGPAPAGPRDADLDRAQHGARLARTRCGASCSSRASASGASRASGRRACSLRYGRLSDPASSLSGGNQQKIVLAKWLARQPTLLIVDEPTRGIDVGTKAEVHRLLSDLANEGVAILMISSELPEVLGMADRVIVLFEGRVAGEFDRSEATEVCDHARRGRHRGRGGGVSAA